MAQTFDNRKYWWIGIKQNLTNIDKIVAGTTLAIANTKHLVWKISVYVSQNFVNFVNILPCQNLHHAVVVCDIVYATVGIFYKLNIGINISWILLLSLLITHCGRQYSTTTSAKIFY